MTKKPIKDTKLPRLSATTVIAVAVEPDFGAIGRPDDNQFVDCAVAGNAAYIVSGDAHLLTIREVRGIPIIRPSVFLAILSNPVQESTE